jgi:proline iminopeptidase
MRRLDDVFFAVGPTLSEGELPVSEGCTVHWEQSGNLDGVPWIEAHGGPGGRANAFLRALVDGRRCRVIQFDQRGCGRSTPVGGLEANSLQHTIADMEALRVHLGIEKWIVGGASWGSTVALAYAEAHPERCIGVKVSGVWLVRKRDVDWWYHGVREIFPEVWDAYAAGVPDADRDDLRGAYARLILGGDAAAAAAQFLYEEAFMHIEPPFVAPNPERGVAYSRIFAHYAANGFWLRENQLIEDAHRLKGIPVSLTTGRYDMCTTPVQAWDMAKALEPDLVRVQIINAAGHYPSEPAMSRAVAQETAAFLDWLAQLGHI